MEYIVLNNGIKCPVVGIGTYMLSPADAKNSVREALKMRSRKPRRKKLNVSQRKKK